MPETAPISKYKATKGYGAEVILYGKFIHESMKKAEELIRERNLTLVHPYDDPLIIAGQGTAGLEMAKEKPDVVIVPIGGGGLISGVSVALKGINPNTKVIGVQSFASPSLKISKELGRLTDIEPSYSIADGILVKSPSSLTFEIVSEYVDDIVLVDDYEIAWAMMMLLERSKTVVEPAGAAPLAALLSGKVEARGKKVMALLSGGNVDLSLLARIIDKTLYKTKRIVKARVIVPDKPGYLNKVLNHVAQIRGNIIDVVHDRVSSDVLPGYTKIYVMFEVAEQEDLGKFIVSLQNENIEVKLIE